MIKGTITEVTVDKDGRWFVRAKIDDVSNLHDEVVKSGIHACSTLEDSQLVEVSAGIPGCLAPFLKMRCSSKPAVRVGDPLHVGVCKVKKIESALEALHVMALDIAKSHEISYAKAYTKAYETHPNLAARARAESRYYVG